MQKWFDIDSPIMTALSRLADMALLSVLWVVCCIPVITIGPATAAMYYVAMKWARKEEIKTLDAFTHSFKENFKQGVALNLIFLILGAVIVVDYFYMSAVDSTYGTICSICFFVMGIWLLCTMFYAYPLQAQFYNTVKQTLINAAQLAVRKFPITVAVFVLNALPVIIGLVSYELLIRSVPVLLLLAPGVIAFVNGKLFVKIFDPLLESAKKQQEQENNEA